MSKSLNLKQQSRSVRANETIHEWIIVDTSVSTNIESRNPTGPCMPTSEDPGRVSSYGSRGCPLGTLGSGLRLE